MADVLATVAAPTPSPTSRDARFDAGHLTKDLARRTVRGGAITLSSQGAKFVVRMAATAVLARMLAPTDFGLIAMIAVVTGFVEMFKDAGLSTATIQRETVTHTQVSTLFWINTALGAALSCVVALLAPLIALFYGEPRLTMITLALTGSMLLGGMAVQHQALLKRQMAFGRLAMIEIASLVTGVGVAVLMAYRGFGYWALVAMTIATATSTAVFSFALSGWIPGLPRRGCGVQPMLAFGSRLAGANTFNYLTRNVDNVIIGFMHGATSLGLYSRGYTLFLMPLNQFLAPMTSVAVPALSRVVDRPACFRELLLQKSYFVVFCVALSTGYSFCAAPELVEIVLGPGWSPVATIVRCLSIGGAVYGTNIAGGWVCTTHGWTDRQLRVAMIAGPVYAASYLLGSVFGPVGVACSFSITCCLLRYPVFRYLLAGSPIRPFDLIGPLLIVGSLAAVAATVAIGVTATLAAGTLATLIAKSAAFAAVVLAACLMRLIRLPRFGSRNARDEL